MMHLTQYEYQTLRSFGKQWSQGDTLWLIDHLACRGLLERGTKTF